MTTLPLPLNPTMTTALRRAHAIAPGLLLCLLVALTAFGLEAAERQMLGRNWLEALVLAIVVGTGVRIFWRPGVYWQDGIAFSARCLLEIAVVLLGASVSAGTILAVGPWLLGGIAATVAMAILISLSIGHLFGLPARMALLIACGNSICGNSAIAAVAPVIGADSDDVAAAIAFTAVLGVAVVLGLPLVGLSMGMNAWAYGSLAGLTVYAVPQVLAAAAPLGSHAVQIGTLVKLVRVLMLGPVCLILAMVAPRLSVARQVEGIIVTGEGEGASSPRGRIPAFSHLVPWFIIGFLAMMGLRSMDLIATGLLAPIATAATLLTVLSMAALGLGVDPRAIAGAGWRVAATVLLSLAALGGISLLLLRLLGLL